jgi:hypothetical protein
MSLLSKLSTQRRHFRATALVLATLASAAVSSASPASAGWRYGSGWGVGAGVAAGVVGGLALGAIASRNYARPYVYEEPVYGDCYAVRQRVWTQYGWRIVRRTVCE